MFLAITITLILALQAMFLFLWHRHQRLLREHTERLKAFGDVASDNADIIDALRDVEGRPICVPAKLIGGAGDGQTILVPPRSTGGGEYSLSDSDEDAKAGKGQLLTSYVRDRSTPNSAPVFRPAK